VAAVRVKLLDTLNYVVRDFGSSRHRKQALPRRSREGCSKVQEKQDCCALGGTTSFYGVGLDFHTRLDALMAFAVAALVTMRREVDVPAEGYVDS